jgi:hypothetical protein
MAEVPRWSVAYELLLVGIPGHVARETGRKYPVAEEHFGLRTPESERGA